MSIADGMAVFSRAVGMMVEASQAALARAGLSASDIDCFIPHQANARIITAVAQQLGIPSDRMITTVALYANSSAGTIPLSLSIAAGEGRLHPGTRLLMCAAGAGLTGGAVVYAL
jgi:3-oxoacyl-[acyl-carrier-protein] synthase-3